MKPRSSKRTWDILTSADDTTLVLNRNYKPDLMITGTGVLQVYDLGDATTYPLNNGRTSAYRNIYNGTPEFIGVINSDGTVFHRVPPRAVCECVLMDNSTAAGVWWSDIHKPDRPNAGWDNFIEFMSQITTSSTTVAADFGLTIAKSGAGAAMSALSSFGLMDGIGQGGAGCSTGTTISGYSLAYAPYGVYSYVGSGCKAFECRQAVNDASTAAEEYIARVGFGDNITGGAHTEGAYFLYDRYNGGGAAQNNWMLRTVKTAGGAASTSVDSGVAPLVNSTGAAWQKLRVEVSSAAARADFWIDNVQVSAAGGQANLPAATTSTVKPINFGITKNEDVGVTARMIRFDYVRGQNYPTALR